MRYALHRGAATLSRCGVAPARRLSQQAAQWSAKLRYGSDECPIFGSWGGTFSDGALATRQTYCKALVFAAGGGRRARDWIAGCAAMCAPNQTLLSVALQYAATEDDVVALREHLLERLIGREAAGGAATPSPSGGGGTAAEAAATHSHSGDAVGGAAGTGAAATGNIRYTHDDDDDDDENTKLLRQLAEQLVGAQVRSSASASSSSAAGAAAASPAGLHHDQQHGGLRRGQQDGGVACGDGPLQQLQSASGGVGAAAAPLHTPEEIAAAEACVLRASAEVRCFMYDAMTASLFHCHSDAAVVAEARRRVFRLGETHFGLSPADLTPLWRTVEAELILRREKLRMLGQPWGE